MTSRQLDLSRTVGSLTGAVICIALFKNFGATYYQGFALELGSVDVPVDRHLALLAWWMLLGTPAALLLARAFVELAAWDRLRTRFQHLSAINDTTWLVASSLVGVALPAMVRVAVLGTVPLTDDEGAYEFMARLVLQGKLYALSPSSKAHFDISFMVNDGKYYSHFFMGWPALLAPGVLLGLPKYINALYSGALTAGLFLLARRVVGSAWARLATVVYLTSVLYMVGAATQLSHTSCSMALVWLAVAALRSRDEGRVSPWLHAAVAALFSAAFFIRPLTAVGFGVPLLVYWLVGAWRLDRRQRLLAITSFCAVATLFAVLFFAVCAAQTGSPLEPPYQAYLKYTLANDYRFSAFVPGYNPAISSMDFAVREALARFAATLLRVSIGSFGWPFTLVLLLAAAQKQRVAIFFVMLAWYCVTNLAVYGAGVDTFGPIKWTEIGLVLLLLAVTGLSHAQDVLSRLGPRSGWLSHRFPMSLGCALTVVSVVGYAPPRLAAVARVATAVDAPLRLVEQAGLGRALVFVGEIRTPSCASEPTNHFVNRRPYNTPGFDAPILWVNRLDPQKDSRLRAMYPDRSAYHLVWRQCHPRLVPFDAAIPSTE